MQGKACPYDVEMIFAYSVHSDTPSEATGRFDLCFSAANSVNPGSDNGSDNVSPVFLLLVVWGEILKLANLTQ